MQNKSILDRRAPGLQPPTPCIRPWESKHWNEYTKQHILLNTPGREKKLGEQVNQKLLYRESDWWDVGSVVQKARKQGTVYVKVRFGRILQL